MLDSCLDGLRVLDLSQYNPGPFATLMLSDLGAEVVKVEPPAGDPQRSFGPLDADGLSPVYKVLNRNKTIIRLDLKSAEGKADFAKLVARADVLLEAYRPGVMDRLGFGRAALAAVNPRLVHCALTGFGQTGPYRLRAGHDLTYVAVSGGQGASGTADRPVMTFPPLADHAGAMQAVASILAALLKRARTGKGVFLDVALSESLTAWQYGALNVRPGPVREGDVLNGGAAYYRLYRTADGRFAALAPLEEKFWRAFCEAAGRLDLLPRHADALPQTALIAEVAALFASRTLAEWQAILDPADCCFEAVLEPGEVPGHPQAAARGLVREGPDGLLDVAFPTLIDAAPPPARQPLREVPVSDVAARWA